MELENKVFVVCGGGSGVGRAVVLGLLHRGARVAAVDVSETALAETSQLAEAALRLSTHRRDVSNRGVILSLPDTVIETQGQVDGLLNIVEPTQPPAVIGERGLVGMEQAMNVNFWGVVNTTTAFLPYLLERPYAAIVNVSTPGGLHPAHGQAAHRASGAAVNAFTESLHAETRDTNLAVTLVLGPTASARARDVSAAETARLVIEALEHGSVRVTIGSDAPWAHRLAHLAPTRATTVIASQLRALLG